MRIAICDDEQKEQALLRAYVERYDSSLSFDLYSSALKLQEAMAETFYDIIFMDIEMEAPNGYEVAKRLMEGPDRPLIVFVTKSSAYTIRGYGVAFRYLRKPVSYAQLSEVLTLALETALPKKLTVTEDGKTLVLSVRDIYYFEIFGHQLTIRTEDRGYTSWCTLGEIMQQLDGSGFAQPHKSYYVNLSHIDFLDKKEIVLTNRERIPLSQRRREEFLTLFQQHLKRSQP